MDNQEDEDLVVRLNSLSNQGQGNQGAGLEMNSDIESFGAEDFEDKDIASDHNQFESSYQSQSPP